jgi:hypothetical protein
VIRFVQNVHAEFVFNMDEVGSEELADRKAENPSALAVRAEKAVQF